MSDIISPLDPSMIECPSWCTVDHHTDGYAGCGHAVHRANLLESTENGRFQIDLWHSTVYSGRSCDEPVKIHLSGMFLEFSDSAALRRHAATILEAADTLDEINSGADK